jgi:hypothetical protein
MAYKITLKASAQKELEKIQKPVREKLIIAINELAEKGVNRIVALVKNLFDCTGLNHYHRACICIWLWFPRFGDGRGRLLGIRQFGLHPQKIPGHLAAKNWSILILITASGQGNRV